MKKTHILVECAIFIAIAAVLSEFKIPFIYGGSITPLSMFPIILISFRHGLKWGMGSGLIYSVVQLLLGLDNIYYAPTAGAVVCVILFDYLLPFTLLGLACIFMIKSPKSTKVKIAAIISGVFLVCLLRFACHLVSGAVIWHGLTDASDLLSNSKWIHSFLYNITYMGPETVLLLLVSPLILKLKDVKINKSHV